MNDPILHIVDDTIQTTNANGGPELMYKWMVERADRQLLDKVQIINSKVSNLEDKPRIYWVHETADNPDVVFLRQEPYKIDLFKTVVCVSNWQQQQYAMILGVPYEKSLVIQNAIEPIPVHDKPKKGLKMRLIYTSAPHKGLEVLLKAFELLNRDDVELDIYSSFKLYDQEDKDKAFKHLYDKADSMDNVFYNPSVSNDQIRHALQQAHIFAYPSIYPETSCIALLEAMSAGLICVVPNLAALPETSANFAWMYNYLNDKDKHAEIYATLLNGAIEQYWEPSVQNILKTQKAYFDLFYSLDQRIFKWNHLMQAITNQT